jgi:hypothetical protein
MRYHNSVEVTELVYKNFDLFMKGKEPEDELFDQLTVRDFLKIFLSEIF